LTTMFEEHFLMFTWPICIMTFSTRVIPLIIERVPFTGIHHNLSTIPDSK
jgi:hypothetical protein